MPTKYLVVGLILFFKPSWAQLDIQGHRGCRGLMPENTTQAMIHAIKLGVSTIEMDVVISKDSLVVLSHEPWMSHEICLDPQGRPFTYEAGLAYNIFQMTFDSIQKFDCGSKFHARFPQRKLMPTAKPLLAELIDSVEAFIKRENIAPVKYNIEIKSTPNGDSYYHPEVNTFCNLVMDVLKRKLGTERVILQSFDVRVLQYLHEMYPEWTLSYLVEAKRQSNMSYFLKMINFIPAIFSPQWDMVDDQLVMEARKLGMRIIPWTVNDKTDMHRLLQLGVDGIITDYPDRLLEVLSEHSMKY